MKLGVVALTAGAVVGSAFWTGCSSVEGPPVLSCEDPERTCAEVGAGFGTLEAECGRIECGRLRFQRVAVGEADHDPGMVATPQGLVLAYLANGGLTVAREQGDGSFTTEVVDPQASAFKPQGLAVGADGAVHVAYLSSSGMKVARSVSGGAFEFLDGPTSSSDAPALAVDPAGVAHLVFRSAEFSPATNRFSLLTVLHAAVSAAGVTEELVQRLDTGGDQGPALGEPSVVVDDEGAVHVLYVWRLGEGLLHHAWKEGAEFTVEQVGPAGGVYNAGQLSALFDTGGRLHVLYPDSPFNLRYAVQKPEGWEVSLVSSSHANRENALAVDAEGRVHAAFHNSNALRYGVLSRGLWPAQDIADCDDGGMRMVFDGTGALRIAQTCHGLSVLAVVGAYPADYLTTCATVAGGICTAACDCAVGGECRTITASGSFGASPEGYCQESMVARICGDATRDPAELYACASALGPFQCGTDSSGEPGALLSDTVCGALFTP